MDTLNIVFGCVTVVAFIYAIVENRKADSLKRLTRRITSDVRSLAMTIYEQNKNTPTEGYAKSIVHILESLISPEKTDIKVGQVAIKYKAYEISPLHTDCGMTVDDSETFYGKAIKGRMEGEREKGLVYGPYEKLPVTGTYQVHYRIKGSIEKDLRADETQPIVRLDVYNHNGSGKIAERLISHADLSSKYTDYSLQFRYDDVSVTLEYRVVILRPHVDISCEMIRIERIGT